MESLVSIIIPNYNGCQFLQTCLDSVMALTYSPLEVFLVDNGSCDGSVEFARQNYPRLKLILNPSNFGFAEAVNQGVRACRGEFVAILNNDTRVDPDWITQLIKVIQTDQSIGICASKQLNFYHQDIIDSVGIQLLRGGFPRNKGHNEKDRGQFNDILEVMGSPGASAFFRKKMFDQLKGFDSDYFAYNEEFDFSLRARLYGWKCVYVPQAKVYHMGGSTRASKDQGFLIFYMERNRLFTIIKNYPLAMILYYLPYLVKYEIDILIRLVFSFEIEPIKARIAALRFLPKMLKKRKEIQSRRKLSDAGFRRLISKNNG